MSVPFLVALVVVFVGLLEFVSWLRYPGGGTREVSEEEVRRVEREIGRTPIPRGG